MTQDEVRTPVMEADRSLPAMLLAVFTYDLYGICTSSRGLAPDGLGLSEKPDALVGARLLDLYAVVPEVRAAVQASLTGHEQRASCGGGREGWVAECRPLRGPGGAVVGGIGAIGRDSRAEAAVDGNVADREPRLGALLESAFDVVFVLDADGRISYVSPAVSRQLGYDPDDLRGRSARELHHPDDRRIISDAWRQILGVPGATARLECRVLHGGGTWRWSEHVLTNLLDDPEVRGVVVNLRDTTERRLAEEGLRELAVRDGLTGLANRTLLLDRIGQALAAGRRSDRATGVVVLDVAGMSAHNKRLGHQAGDALLQGLAARLESAMGDGESAARVGGDMFAVLVEDVASAEELRTRTANLLDLTQEPLDAAGTPVLVDLQVGSSLSPASDAGALLAAAEQAVLRRGQAQVVVGSTSTAAGTAGVASHDAERLRRAIANGELLLHYQPVISLVTGAPVGAEALVRWQHPDRGLLLPAEFIPLAEHSGLVVELGEWVLREALARIAAWQAVGRDLAVGVNLSPRQLVGSAFPGLLRDLLGETGVPPELLLLDVTESAVMDDAGASEVLRAVGELGVCLALDDFGTGYSSLTYLKRFPVDAIKIDRSFVAGLGRDADDEAIVASVVSLARAVGKTVIAEGVETFGQLEALRALRVDQAQGYFWSRAVSAPDLESWLREAQAIAPVRAAASSAPRPARPVSSSDELRIIALHGDGASLHTIAAAMNAEGRRSPGGPRWRANTVARVIAALLPPP